MGEFSAHRINVASGEKVAITNPNYTIYVRETGGNDDLNSGIELGSPYRTLYKAVEHLSDKIITEAGFVTIDVGPGIWTFEDGPLDFDHPQGERIAIVGAPVQLLLLKHVDYYKTTGYTAAGFSGFYSGVLHGITMSCCFPSVNSIFEEIQTDDVEFIYTTPGCGVIVEDYTLVFNKDYNPAFYYVSYPYEFRSNIARQASILGCHKLLAYGQTAGSSPPLGKIAVQSSIKDTWFCTPMPIINGGQTASIMVGNAQNQWTRFFGNPYRGNMYDKASLSDSDVFDISTGVTFWINTSSSLRRFMMSSIPVGYYGTNASNGNPIGATSNVRGLTYPAHNGFGTTASYIKQPWEGGAETTVFFTATGPAATVLNDAIRFGPNYHTYSINVMGTSGEGFSAGWKTVNKNDVTVKIIPTVFKRNGTIMNVKSGGLRKIKNIFFDGDSQPFHYGLLGSGQYNTSGYSNKCGLYATGSKMGENVLNEPTGLGNGLLSNVGFKDFHVGIYCDRSTTANIGIAVVSNCSYSVISNNASYVKLFGSISTGSVNGFCAFNGSTISTDRCFSAFSGHSIVELKLKDKLGSTADFSESSFNAGQTYSSPDGKIRGTVYHWDTTEKTLSIAIRTGALEGRPGVEWGGAF